MNLRSSAILCAFAWAVGAFVFYGVFVHPPDWREAYITAWNGAAAVLWFAVVLAYGKQKD